MADARAKYQQTGFFEAVERSLPSRARGTLGILAAFETISAYKASYATIVLE